MTTTPSNPPPRGQESADAMEPRQRAAHVLAGRRRRVSRIRKGAIGGSLVAFAAAWVVIFSQLVTGNDPVLANSQQAQQAPVTAATPATSDTSPPASDTYQQQSSPPASDTSPQQGSGSGNSSSASDGSSSSNNLDPVTTQQS